MYGLLLKYGIPALIGIGIILGIYFYGHHEGTLAGTAEVATIKSEIAQRTADFERQARAIEAQNAINVQRLKDSYVQTSKTQAVASAKLQSTVSSLQQQSYSYVAQIERLSKTSGAACKSALELANRQYNELADIAEQASTRADSAGAVANTLNDYSSRIN